MKKMNFEFGNVSIKLPVKVGSKEPLNPFELAFDLEFNDKKIGSFQLTLESFDVGFELRDFSKNSLSFKPSHEETESQSSMDEDLEQESDNEQEENNSLIGRELRKRSPKNYSEETEDCFEGKQNSNHQNRQTRRIVKEIKKFQCDDCGAEYRSSTKLRIHHDTVHKGLRPFECQECGKKFGRKDTLGNHLKLHEKDKQLNLQLCSPAIPANQIVCVVDNMPHKQMKENVQEPDSKQNEESFKKEKVKYIECEDCGLCFAQNYKYKIHHDTVHKGLRPFECQECGKTFGRKDVLGRHIKKLHTKDKTYKCQVCDECFSLESDLILHSTTIHANSEISHEAEVIVTLPTFTAFLNDDLSLSDKNC